MRTHEVLVIYKQKTASGLDDQLNDGREFELFKGYHCHRKRISAHFSFIHFKFRNIASIKNKNSYFIPFTDCLKQMLFKTSSTQDANLNVHKTYRPRPGRKLGKYVQGKMSDYRSVSTDAVVQRCSVKKVFSKMYLNLQGNTCARVSF